VLIPAPSSGADNVASFCIRSARRCARGLTRSAAAGFARRFRALFIQPSDLAEREGPHTAQTRLMGKGRALPIPSRENAAYGPAGPRVARGKPRALRNPAAPAGIFPTPPAARRSGVRRKALSAFQRAEEKMGQVQSEVLNVAARLARRANTAWAIAAKAMPGTDRLYWSQVAQDHADMAARLRAAVLIDTAVVEWNAQRPGPESESRLRNNRRVEPYRHRAEPAAIGIGRDRFSAGGQGLHRVIVSHQ
jgi:hypothetical protein